MIEINKTDVNEAFRKIKHLAKEKFLKKQYELSLQHIRSAAIHAYNFNVVYADLELEALIKALNSSVFENTKFQPKARRILFYDCFGWENRGLTQQYISGLIANGYEFLYVFEKKDSQYSKKIENELYRYPDRIEVFELNSSLALIDQATSLHSKIKEYSPEKALLHLSPWCSMALCAFHSFPEIEWININLTDHAFWLGSSLFKKNIEFRDYGYTVSLEKRFLKEDQLVCLPYYPIVERSVFLDFPENIPINDKVVIFSGAAFYKVYGEDGTYFHILDRLLKENPEVVIFFAGTGDSTAFQDFIKKNHYERRVALLGHRRDIAELFQHCDIYLGSYPFGGGLMSQYAAVMSKPILAYTSNDLLINLLEAIICHNKHISITYTNFDEFFRYARSLVQDAELRRSKGRELSEAVISSKSFNQELNSIIFSGTSNRRMNSIAINYEKFYELNIEIENNYLNVAKNFLVSQYKLQSVILFPKFAILCFKKYMIKTFKTLWSRMFK